MNANNRARGALLGLYVVAMCIITWLEVKKEKRVPAPRRYVGSSIAFGTLGLIGPLVSYPLAAVFGAGLVIVLLYNLFGSSDGVAGIILNTPARPPSEASPVQNANIPAGAQRFVQLYPFQ